MKMCVNSRGNWNDQYHRKGPNVDQFSWNQHGLSFSMRIKKNTMDSEIRYHVRESLQILEDSEYSPKGEDELQQDNFSFTITQNGNVFEVTVSKNENVCNNSNSNATSTGSQSYELLELQSSSHTKAKSENPSQTNQYPAECSDSTANHSRLPAVNNAWPTEVSNSNISVNRYQNPTPYNSYTWMETLSRCQYNNDPNLTQYPTYNAWQTLPPPTTCTQQSSYSKANYNNNLPLYNSIPGAKAKNSQHSVDMMLNERNIDQEMNENEESLRSEARMEEEYEDKDSPKSDATVKSEPVSPQSFLYREHICKWQDADEATGELRLCALSFPTMYEIVEHITAEHVTTDTDKLFFVCNWENCERKLQPFKARYKLINHIR